MRDTGIDIVGPAPWGTHLCQFYETAQDLTDILVPYIAAGLRQNEFCMWVTSEPLPMEQARAALEAAVGDLEPYLRSGQLEILDYGEWYTAGGKFEADRVLRGWVERLEAAQERGFEGLRLTGNTFWLEQSDWRDFTEYEATVDSVIGQYRMLAICTYSLRKCGAPEILDVMANHAFAIIKHDGAWQIIESAERKRVEEALRRSEQRWATTLASIGDAVIATDCAGAVVFMNPVAEQLTGWTSEEAIGRSVDEVFHIVNEQTRQQVESPMVRALREGTVVSLANHTVLVRKDGTDVPIDDSGAPIRDERGEMTGVVLVFRDITERKQAEAALRESQAALRASHDELEQRVRERTAEVHAAERYARSLLEASLDPLVTISPKGKITDVNAATIEVTGISREALIGSDFSSHFTEPEKAEAGYQQVLTQGEVRDYPLTIRHTSGRMIDVIYNATLYRNEADQVQGVFAAARDVTERRRAEAAVAAERQRFNDVIEALPVYLVLLTPDYHVAVENRFFRERFGESKGRRCFEYLWGRDEPCENCETYTVMKTNRPHRWEWTGPDGRSYDIVDFPFTDVDGSPLVMEVGIDVTERTRAEEAVAAERQRFFDVLETAPAMICLMTEDYRVAFANRSFRERFGESPGRHCHEYCFGRAEPCEFCETHRVLETGEPHHWEVTTPDGSVIDVHDFPFTDVDGTPMILKMDMDITEWRRTEAELARHRDHLEELIKDRTAALAASQEDLSRAQEVGQIGSWRLDVRKNVLAWSPETHRIFGVPAGTPMSYEAFLECIYPDDRQYVDTQWQASLRGEPDDIEHRIVADGQIKWVREKAYLEFDGAGELVGGFGIAQDITERKQAEEALLEAERARANLAGMLASEIAHRTKNNLAILAGLLQLQMDREGASGSQADMIQDAVTRIMSFSALHEQMYQSRSDRVELLDAVRHVAAVDQQTLSLGEVMVSVEGAPIECRADVATNLCVVANELITNAIKHGGLQQGRHEIEVRLGREYDNLLLSVWSSGNSIAADFDVGARGKTGLDLVRAIVETQYGGSFTLSPDRGGTLARVTLDEERLSKP